MIRLGFFRSSERRTWLLWLAVCSCVFVANLATISYSPVVIQDEVQIVDYGRAAMDPATDWSMSWDIVNNHSVLPIYYLGSVLQELAYKAAKPSDLGPRLFSLLSAVIAASCALGWLLARGTPPAVSLVLASAFLLDPVFAENYRLARIDGWAVACCLAACWLLRRSKSGANGQWRKAFLAGMFLVIAPFTWPVVIMLFPLVFLELYDLVRHRLSPADKSAWFYLPGIFAAGGILTAGVLLIPVIFYWPEYVDSLFATAEVQGRAAVIQSSVIDLLAIHDPLIVLVALTALLFKREYTLLGALGLAVLIMYQSMIYSPRIIYLLPYFLAGIAGATSETWNSKQGGYGKPVMVRALAVLMAWNIGEVLIFHNYISIQPPTSNNTNRLLPAFQQAVGAGSYRVYLEEWPAYYAGRELGWKIWNAGSPVGDAAFSRFLQTMDFVIVAEQPYQHTILNKMKALDFELQSTLSFQPFERTDITFGPINIPAPALQSPNLLIYRNTR